MILFIIASLLAVIFPQTLLNILTSVLNAIINALAILLEWLPVILLYPIYLLTKIIGYLLSVKFNKNGRG